LVPIISTASPFRRIPVDLPRRQILYFDALRLSAEMAGLAFDHLGSLLISVCERESGPVGDTAVRAILDAYSVIDSVHRFRQLLQVTPRLEHNAVLKLFLRQSKDVEDLRHIVQHLNRDVDRIVQEGLAALGTLTWLGPSLVSDGPPRSYVLQAGTSYPGQWTHGPVIDLWSSLPSGTIADISLATAGCKVNLSSIMKNLGSIVRSLERSLEEFAENKERFGSDVLLTFALTPVEQTVESVDPLPT